VCRLAKLTASAYLAFACFSPFALPGQPLAEKPIVRVEFKILAEEYRICLKKVLADAEASISQKLAKHAQEVPGLKFVTWSAARAPGAPVLSVFLDDRKAGFGKNIILRFDFNSQPFTLSTQSDSQPMVYNSYEEHSPGDRYKLEAKIEDLWKKQLRISDFRQQIREFLKQVPIANDVSIPIPNRNLVIIPVRKDDMQPGEGSKLRVVFQPLKPHSEDDAVLILETLESSPHEWWRNVASTVSDFEFPSGSHSTRWPDRILSVYSRKNEKKVEVFMSDYRWKFESTADKTQTSP
jgi:hypothetical protein